MRPPGRPQGDHRTEQPEAGPETRPRRRVTALASCIGTTVVGLTATVSAPSAPPSVRDQVWAAEQAFARTMAARDLVAFADFVSEEAVFFSGTTALRGRRAVVEGWARFFAGPQAPFSWAPDQVEVLDSGELAFSTGPVRDPSGQVVARFNSVWRLEARGRWRVVFDKGGPPSPGPP